MSIPDFDALLTGVLNGDSKALLDWDFYASNNRFSKEQIDQTLKAIKKILPYPSYLRMEPLTIPESHALTLHGYMYAHGLGSDKNYHRAMIFYEEAIDSETPNANALDNLGYLYYCGLGINQDFTEARLLYEKAMGLGNANATTNLAFMHQHGQGIPRNLKTAIEYYQHAIGLGSSNAMVHLANIFLDTSEPFYDPKQAMSLLDNACFLENRDALMYRAALYAEEQTHYFDAITLYEKAYALGRQDAKQPIHHLVRLHLKNTLKSHEIELHGHLEDLKKISDSLVQKAKNNKTYDVLAIQVTLLHKSLHDTMELFFNTPSQKAWYVCLKHCTSEIDLTLKPANIHRGWYQTHEILRAIVGILAAITIIPALCVEAYSTHGYIKTFFKTPNTKTYDDLMALQSKLDETLESITKSWDNRNTPSPLL